MSYNKKPIFHLNAFRNLRLSLKNAITLLSLPVTLLIFAGCAGLPTQDEKSVAQILSRRSGDVTSGKAIDSEYQDLADKIAKQPSNGEAPHYLTLLDVGDDAFMARLHLFRAARKSIDIQTFIWHDDPCSRLMFD